MLPVDLRERPFVLETLVFWKRVRKLAGRRFEVTGGPMGNAGEVFDLLDAVCDAFEPGMKRAMGVEGVTRRR